MGSAGTPGAALLGLCCLFMSAVAAVVLGVLIAARWPASSFFVIGRFIAIERVMNGWTMIALAARAAGSSAQAPQSA